MIKLVDDGQNNIKNLAFAVWNSTSAHFPWSSKFYFMKVYTLFMLVVEMVAVSGKLAHHLHCERLWDPLE